MTIKRERVAWFLVAAMCLSVPAWAQVDLTGTWLQITHEDALDRGLGSDPVDFTGLPINDQARARGLHYDQAAFSLPERQCIMFGPWYLVLGPALTRITSEIDETTGVPLNFKIRGTWDRGTITIWLDGRPHPSENALHTDPGFSTGEWQGNTLKVVTTHFKEGPVRRTGVPISDRTKLTTYITRYGDILTATMFFEDPVYLAEPHVLSRHWRREPMGRPIATNVLRPCTPFDELAVRRGAEGDGTVPHYLPDQNPALHEFSKTYGIPLEAVMGGPETLYPEYQKKLKGKYMPPDKCTRYCCTAGGAPNGQTLACIQDGSGKPLPFETVGGPA